MADKAQISFTQSVRSITKTDAPYTMDNATVASGVTTDNELYLGNSKIDNSGNAYEYITNGKKYTIEGLKYDSTTKQLNTKDLIIKDVHGEKVSEAIELPLDFVASFEADIDDKVHGDSKKMRFAAHQKINLLNTVSKLSAAERATQLAGLSVQLDPIATAMAANRDRMAREAFKAIAQTELTGTNANVDNFVDTFLAAHPMSYTTLVADFK